MKTIDIGPERDSQSAHENEGGSPECDVVVLRNNQRQLVTALKLLFDLLEEYAPSWYTAAHHTKALAALHFCSHE